MDFKVDRMRSISSASASPRASPPPPETPLPFPDGEKTLSDEIQIVDKTIETDDEHGLEEKVQLELETEEPKFRCCCCKFDLSRKKAR